MIKTNFLKRRFNNTPYNHFKLANNINKIKSTDRNNLSRSDKSANQSLKPKKGEAYRDNDRFSIENIKFSQELYDSGLSPLVSNGQKFGQHYDDSVQDSLGRISEWTLLIYLNGGDNENEPERGMALLHKHGHDCLLHEAKEVKRGFKYVAKK
ncbi:unnamed protein product [Rhizophagus irregularis]|nr:unnamed protein product [Rhizophagus irregularis]